MKNIFTYPWIIVFHVLPVNFRTIDCELHIFVQAINNIAAHEGILLMQEIMKMTAASQGMVHYFMYCTT